MAGDRYSSARLKVERAIHHVNDLERHALDFVKTKTSVHIETNSETGFGSLKFISEPIDPTINLIFGDAVTNLRSALDHAYTAALGKSKEPGQIFFPIRDTRQSVIATIQKGHKKGAIPQALQDVIVDQIKPYDGGHPTLTALNKLANTDKHRLLISVASISGVVASFSAGGLTFDKVPFAAKAGEEFEIGPLNFKFHRYPQRYIHITIGETEPRIFHEAPVIQTLLRLSDDVADVIRAVSAAVPL